MNDVISLAQYEDIHTPGIASMREVDELNKALEAGYDNPPVSGGGALRVESLEASLKVLTHQAKHCVMWQKVAKIPAYSTVEEYNQLAAVGGETGAFLPEGILPETEDSVYNRQVELVKFLGTTRSVTHPMTLVRTSIGDVIAQENTNGILWLLKNIENGLFFGNGDMCYHGMATGSDHREGVEFNGLEKQISSENVIDMKGASLDEGTFSTAAQIIASNYGIPSDAFLSFGAHDALCKLLLPKERLMLPTNSGGYSIGANVDGVNTPFGKVSLNPDVFLNNGKTSPSSATNAKAPATPAAVALDTTPMTGTDGVWADHGGAGVYSYAVSAVNRFGESAAKAIAADLTVAAGDLAKHAVIKITNAADVANPTEYFNIYKTKADGTILSYVGRVACDDQGAGAVTTWNDPGLWMAGTTKAFVGEMTPQVFAVKQLAPLMKMDLAILAPSIRWMILCYLTVILYAPKKWVKIINIG